MTPEERLPGRRKDTFTCPDCGVYTTHEWDSLDSVEMSQCEVHACGGITLWVGTMMVYPDRGGSPPPHPDLSEGPRADYEEAASVSGRSSRAAAGLLRVCIERLVNELEPDGKDLSAKVGILVEKGLKVEIQQALDTLRVIGNEAVHPGQMDVNDKPETVSQLFGLVNIVVDTVITQPKAIAKLFDDSLTDKQKAGIERRDLPSA